MTPERTHRRADACDECGHRVQGTVAVPRGVDATVLCEECADGHEYGTFVRERYDPEAERWYPGIGERSRLVP